jgi:2-keto-4-pentenoate hydratase
MTATSEDIVVRQSARELFRALESGCAIEPLTERHPDLDVDTAYMIQRELVVLHRNSGRRVVGRKIGLTSAGIQAQLGVSSPDYGVVLDTYCFGAGAVLSRSDQRLIAPRLEAELAFVLAYELGGPGLTVDGVLQATTEIVPVFEIVDSRIADWRIKLPDTVADNASCFGVIVGSSVPLERVGPLQEVEVVVERDGEEMLRGTGDAVLGHPAAAVAWLGNELARFGEALPAGQLVLSGSFTPAADSTPGSYVARFSGGIGELGVTICA